MNSEYKGFIIDYNRNNTTTPFEVESISGNYDTIEKAEEAIDRHIKGNRKIERLPVFIEKSKYGGGGYKEAEITSITEKGDIWTVDGSGSRSKIGSEYSFCCEITDSNKLIIDEVLSMRDNAKKIMDDSKELIKTVDRSLVSNLVKKLKK